MMKIENYFTALRDLLEKVEITDVSGRAKGMADGIIAAVNALVACGAAGRKAVFIGNGGSAAIAGHMATDCWKIGGIRAMAFNDASLLTCIGNDCGIEQLFARPLSMFADPGDVLVAISSSGRSPNILNGVEAARQRECVVVTLSGMDAGNPLRLRGDLNFYVPSGQYGLVETVHHALCHAILDAIGDRIGDE